MMGDAVLGEVAFLGNRGQWELEVPAIAEADAYNFTMAGGPYVSDRCKKMEVQVARWIVLRNGQSWRVFSTN